MCRCTPEIRTPFCGKLNCDWPKPEGARGSFSNDELSKLEKIHTPLAEGGDWKSITIECLIAEIKRRTFERDLAIAHDSQPYPTAEAYENSCRIRDELAALLAGINAHVVPGSLDSIDSLRMMYRERGDFKVKLLSAVKALERIARGAPIVGYDPSEIAQEALDLIMEKKSPTV